MPQHSLVRSGLLQLMEQGADATYDGHVFGERGGFRSSFRVASIC